MFGEASACSDAKAPIFLVQRDDCVHLDAQQSSHLLKNAIEHGLRVERRDDGRAGLEQGRLLLDPFGDRIFHVKDAADQMADLVVTGGLRLKVLLFLRANRLVETDRFTDGPQPLDGTNHAQGKGCPKEKPDQKERGCRNQDNLPQDDLRGERSRGWPADNHFPIDIRYGGMGVEPLFPFDRVHGLRMALAVEIEKIIVRDEPARRLEKVLGIGMGNDLIGRIENGNLQPLL